MTQIALSRLPDETLRFFLGFDHVEIYVPTYREANLFVCDQLKIRNTRRVLLHSPEAMAHHPTGITVEIVGIEASNRGRSCEEHAVCGSVLVEDSVVRIRRVQILNDSGQEEAALAVYWITDGIDRCRVGFLKRHLIKYWEEYEGRIAQVVEFYKDSASDTKRKKNHQNLGCCQAVIIDAVRDDTEPPKKKVKKEDE
jgi:hypothetical protein